MGPNRDKIKVPPIRPLAFAKFDKKPDPAKRAEQPAKVAAEPTKATNESKTAPEKGHEPAKAPARHHNEEKADG